MELEKNDKRMFEYLGHLRFGKVDYNDLSWNDYLSRPSSDWQFPVDLNDYFRMVFLENEDIIKNKKTIIFDMRNLYSPQKMINKNFKYLSIGRN